MKGEITLSANGWTDTGQVRERNEDSIHWFSHPEQPFAYVIVADGMGGYAGGSTASRIAVDTLTMSFSQLLNPAFLACSLSQQKLMIHTALRKGIQYANASIIQEKASNPELSRMGTTLVVAVVWKDQLQIAHVGDSRAYLWGLRGLVQLTRDHSVVQEMVDAGLMTGEEARQSDVRNHITRALGVMDEVEPDMAGYGLSESALLMLCSDGLTEYFDNAEIEHVMATHRPAMDCCYRFVEEANAAGGKDNISVGLLEIRMKNGLGITASQGADLHVRDDTTIRRNPC